MDKDTLNGREVSILTVDEYREALKKYYLSKGNEDTVVWFFSRNGYKFLTKFRSFEDVARIYWKHEPLMKRYFGSFEECMSNLNRNGGMCGVSMRWLPGNGASGKEVVLQPTIVRAEETEAQIDEITDTSLHNRILGMLMDPFVYVSEFNEGEYRDVKDKRYADLSNYRVFMTEISREEYEKMESEYVESIRTWKYDDSLLRRNTKYFEMTDELKEFYRKHTHYLEDEED